MSGGPCAFCGGPDARHRIIDAIVSRCRAGEKPGFVAKDYGLPLAVIMRLVLEATKNQGPV